jgi:hypothetical protein
MTQKTQFPPYSQMVMNLFKPMDGIGSKMMHAAIGMAGESAELRTATGRKNVLEECGDFEFYMEAAWLQLPSSVQDRYLGMMLEECNLQFGAMVDAVHEHSGNLLDFAKKVWVYGGAKGDRDDHIGSELHRLRSIMNALYAMIGTDIEEVRYGNQVKLLGTAEEKGRYSSGTYSDEQALARADKESEKTADRKFFGQTKRV